MAQPPSFTGQLSSRRIDDSMGGPLGAIWLSLTHIILFGLHPNLSGDRVNRSQGG